MNRITLIAIICFCNISLGFSQLTTVKLNPDYNGNTDIAYFLVSSDGSRVIYRANQDVSAVSELYSVPITGGPSVKLNGPIIASNGGVMGTTISNNSERVVYNARQDTESLSEIYSAPIEGGSFTKLNAPFVVGGLSQKFRISANSEIVVYHANQEVVSQYNIYSVPITGGTPVKLNQNLNSFADVDDYYLISADNSKVVYLADNESDGRRNLFSVDIGGGVPVQLNNPLGSQENVGIEFRITPDGSTVVYGRTTLTTELKAELYSVPITGGTPVKLNDPLVSGGDVDVESVTLTPNGSRVLYLADQEIDDTYELYSVPVGGGSVTKLNSLLVSGGDVELDDILFTSDSATVIYRADQNTNNVFELYSVPSIGGTPSKINGPMVFGRSVNSRYFLSHDDSTVIYLADQETNNVNELYSAPIAGGSFTKLNGPLVSGGDVVSNEYAFSYDDAYVVYKADQEVDGVFELYRVELGSGSIEKINQPLVSGGFVTDFVVSPTSDVVVYRADQDIDNVAEIYSTFEAPSCTLFIDCPAPINVITDPGICSTTNVDLGIPVTSNCPDEMITNDAPSVFPIGETSVTWVVTDGSGLTVNCVQLVTVEDIEAPVITCPLDFTIDPGDDDDFYQVPNFYSAAAVFALDNCTNPVTLLSQIPIEGTLLPIGTHEITLFAEDEFGNVGSCSFEITVDGTFGLEEDEIGIDSIAVYPNPATAYVTIYNPNLIDMEDIEILDLTGRIVDCIKLPTLKLIQQFDISNFADGIYILRIQSGANLISKQLIIHN